MDTKNILIIDDSNTNLVLLNSLLEKKGYNVISALSAMEGIELIKNELPDLIYLDLLMPDVDGLQFISIIKENDSWNEIPIVILSAVSDKDIIRKSMKMGIVDYIIKPINIHKILSLTENILSN